MLELPNSFLFKLFMRTLFPGFILLSCLVVEGMYPLTSRSATYVRQCRFLEKGSQYVSGRSVELTWMERNVFRYDRGIDIVMCTTSGSRNFKIDCISRVSYELQNNGTYLKIGNVGKNSIFEIVCNRYFF